MSSQSFYTIVVMIFAIVVVILSMIYNKIRDSDNSKFRDAEENRHENELRKIDNGKA